MSPDEELLLRLGIMIGAGVVLAIVAVIHGLRDRRRVRRYQRTTLDHRDRGETRYGGIGGRKRTEPWPGAWRRHRGRWLWGIAPRSTRRWPSDQHAAEQAKQADTRVTMDDPTIDSQGAHK